MMSIGLFHLSWWQVVFVSLGFTHITIIAVTLFLHRCQTHCSISLSPSISHFFRLWLWLTTGMVTKEWVAIHRKHHAKVETAEDPHSPIIKGINRILWLGVFEYVKESRHEETIKKFGGGTPNDWLERKVYSRRPTWGIFLMLSIDLVLFGLTGLGIWVFQMVWIPFTAAGVINGIGHYFGYRNFDLRDFSTNIVPWGILIGGEELHNNHHAFPASAKLSSRWFEFDIGYLYIRLLEAVGLGKIKRMLPSVPQIGSFVDDFAEQVILIKRSKVTLLSEYRNKVKKPVSNWYMKIVVLPNANLIKAFLLDRRRKFNANMLEQVHAALSEHDILRVIEDFSQQLETVIMQRAQDTKEYLANIRDWCERAKVSKIDYLVKYAEWLQQRYLPDAALVG